MGARNEFILLNFLTEAVVLSVLGGLIGILITWGIAGISNSILANTDNSFRLIMTWANVGKGIMFASIIGILAGLIPAYRASKLVPVEAIRSK